MIINLINRIYHISFENRKLQPTKTTNFFIWNLPAVRTCPFRTRLCELLCYALKSENLYKDVLPARRDNLAASKLDTFVSDMTGFILDKARRQRKPRLIVRIHESGDFYNRDYAEKWLQIARNCQACEKVLFIAYTKSFAYFDGVDLPANFSLRASIWADTDPEQVKIILRNGWPIYTAVESFTDKDAFHQCRCEDCATCGACWDKTIPDIRCEIH